MKAPRSKVIYELTIHPHDDKDVVRVLQVIADSSLYRLAHDITFSFGYLFDHCFGFYERLDDTGDSLKKTGRVFELFADIDRSAGKVPDNPGTLVPLTQLWERLGDTWYFLFDYGDSRTFEVTLTEYGVRDKYIIYPNLMVKVGEAQAQYPNYDEDEDYDEE